MANQRKDKTHMRVRESLTFLASVEFRKKRRNPGQFDKMFFFFFLLYADACSEALEENKMLLLLLLVFGSEVTFVY